MGLKLSQSNLQKLFVMFGADALALLVALFHQFREVKVSTGSGMIPVRTGPSSQWAWIIFGVMLLLTVLFVLICREEEVIKGLPPKRNEFDDEEEQ